MACDCITDERDTLGSGRPPFGLKKPLIDIDIIATGARTAELVDYTRGLATRTTHASRIRMDQKYFVVKNFSGV